MNQPIVGNSNETELALSVATAMGGVFFRRKEPPTDSGVP